MQTFHCTHCQFLVFFENTRCLNCGKSLAYLPDRQVLAALREETNGVWAVEGKAHETITYRLCTNYATEAVCNWAVLSDDPDPLCRSCRLTRVIPNLGKTSNREAWLKLEAAKRRAIYSLLGFALPVEQKSGEDDRGLAFEFLEDTVVNGDAKRVMTGHDNGLITINISEADDVKREAQRKLQNEPYRTLLGHFRHEIGHYYWDRLIKDGRGLEPFRELFGDERADYQVALQEHYEKGPPVDWQNDYVSAYASTHPWEDWAESWAHFQHMADALETAGSVGLTIRPRRSR